MSMVERFEVVGEYTASGNIRWHYKNLTYVSFLSLQTLGCRVIRAIVMDVKSLGIIFGEDLRKL